MNLNSFMLRLVFIFDCFSCKERSNSCGSLLLGVIILRFVMMIRVLIEEFLCLTGFWSRLGFHWIRSFPFLIGVSFDGRIVFE